LRGFSQAIVGNGGSRLRVAITLRRFDAHFASKVQWRKIFRKLSKSLILLTTFIKIFGFQKLGCGIKISH